MRKLDCQETESPETLQAKLDSARDGLRNLDRSIRKILGRDVDGEGVSLQPPRLHVIQYSFLSFSKVVYIIKEDIVIVCKLKLICTFNIVCVNILYIYLFYYIYIFFYCNLLCFRLSQKRPLLEDRRRPTTEFVNNDIPGGKRRWQSSNTEPKTVFSRLSARVPSTADDSADEDDSVVKVTSL